MASNKPINPRQPGSQPFYPSSPATWTGQNTRSEPYASHPAPATHRRTAAPPTNAHYLPVQHGNLGHSPHGGAQPGLYPESAQRTQMDDSHYHPSYATSPRPHEASVGGPTARRDIDRPTIQLNQPAPRRITSADSSGYFAGAASTDHSYRSAQRNNSSTAPSMGYPADPPSQRHSAQDLSPGANDMSNMLSEFSLTSSSSSSSASPISPYNDRAALRPSIYTMQVHSNSLEAVEDPEGHGRLSSLIESASDMYHMDTGKDAGTMSLFPQSVTDPRGRWSRPAENMANNRAYDNPSRSASSQSSASHSTSDSDISSLPNGVGPPGRSPTSGSTSGAPRRNKMHQCKLCGKWFPRPSGLDTHMNSHSGAKREPLLTCLTC